MFDSLNIMLSFPDKPDRLSDAALRQFVSRAIEKGWVRQGFHSEVERADRNISDEDIVFGLEQKEWKVTNAELLSAIQRLKPLQIQDPHEGH